MQEKTLKIQLKLDAELFIDPDIDVKELVFEMIRNEMNAALNKKGRKIDKDSDVEIQVFVSTIE